MDGNTTYDKIVNMSSNSLTCHGESFRATRLGVHEGADPVKNSCQATQKKAVLCGFDLPIRKHIKVSRQVIFVQKAMIFFMCQCEMNSTKKHQSDQMLWSLMYRPRKEGPESSNKTA